MKLSRFAALLALVALPRSLARKTNPSLEGGDGPRKGKHIVLVSGDQEYRSEEALPQLAKILSKHHGFKCTVLFTVDPKDGTVNPNINNVPGLEALKTADLLVIFTRFLNLPDDQMQHVVDYVAAGKPVVGLRTATHAFNIPKDRKFAKFSWSNGEADFKQGFGKQVLGETWVAPRLARQGGHARYRREGTGEARDPEGNCGRRNLRDHGRLHGHAPATRRQYAPRVGEVTETLKPESKAVSGKKNDPMMPVAWTKTYKGEGDKAGRVFTTTMGASQDLEFEGTRRLIVNGCFWAAGLESKIPDKANVDLVGTFKPTPFKFRGNADWKPGVTPADLLK
ncbi:ThuA domain-containing protein [Gemmata palustris]|uniref:ThuA domain-containing protein n=1 Tax=Gemmata palustris TaxID=2822762 RepID=UPI001FEC11EF|nr:ThuA domain-containing protein [Gemmata palustris]